MSGEMWPMRKPAFVRSVSAAAGLLAVLGFGTPAHAQAWVPDRGEGAVSIIFQSTYGRDHYFTTTKVDFGEIRSDALVLDVSYGVTRRLAVDLSLPYIASKYTGTKPHPSALDDGSYHASAQDFRMAVRYGVRAGRFAVTPYVGSIVPSHGYEYWAHAAPGRQLRELQIGTYVATLLDPYVPGLFVQARLGYGFTERVIGIHHNRSMADLEVGYFLSERARVFVLGSGQITHGGIDIPTTGPLPAELRPFHDQIDRLNYLNAGFGGSFALTDSFDVFGSMLTNQANRNGHALNRGINVGVTWSFKRGNSHTTGAAPPAPEPKPEPTPAGQQARALIRCVCQKGER